MPFYHAPIMHDRQSIQSDGEQSTSSSDFADLVGATITTKNDNGCFIYHSVMPIVASCTLNNTIASLRVLLNGDQIGEVKTFNMKLKDIDIGYTLTSDLGGVEIPENSALKIQFSTDKGTLTILSFSILVDGIPCERVIE